jgi:hypothetical protein
MPFDGTGYDRRIDALDRIDRAAALVAREEHWCKGRIYTEDGRRCLLGALKAVSGQAMLKAPVLQAIRQETGRHYASIPRFNDDLSTTHGTVLRVLERTRLNLASGTAEPSRSVLRPQWLSTALTRCRKFTGGGI